MEKSESLSELLNSEENINVKRKCSKRLIKCIGIILFCSFSVGISFYAGISYNNYLNDNSESL
tara:strand:+ start:2291 stop:2479 length:189 start_codon:yes stop_codon:yes gene_type:complete